MPESSWESELTEDRHAIRSPEAKGGGEGVNTAGVFSGRRICETGKERRRGGADRKGRIGGVQTAAGKRQKCTAVWVFY